MTKVKVVGLSVQLYSWWGFHLKSFVLLTLCVKFSQFEFQNFQMTSGGERTKTKVEVLYSIYNLPFEKIFIWIHFVS